MQITRFILLITTTVSACLCQMMSSSTASNAYKTGMHSERLPQYLVYRHFLAWVNQLDKAAVASGDTDPYKFAEAFSRANLAHEHLDLIRNEARKLDADLQQKDASARATIARYRAEARVTLAQGKPLPPAPPEISQLQREHTGILVQHYVALRSALGPGVAARLDAYLNYEFAPHIKLKRMSPPGQPVSH